MDHVISYAACMICSARPTRILQARDSRGPVFRRLVPTGPIDFLYHYMLSTTECFSGGQGAGFRPFPREHLLAKPPNSPQLQAAIFILIESATIC